MHELLRDKLLGKWAYAVTHRPWITLGVCTVIAIISAAFAITSLTFQTDRSALVDSDLPWNARYALYKESYPRWDDLIVVVDIQGAPAAGQQFIRHMARAIEALPVVRSADAGFMPLEYPRMFRLAPRDDFNRAIEQLVVLRSVADSPHGNAALASMLASTRSDTTFDGPALTSMLAPFLTALSGEPAVFELPGFEHDTYQTLTTSSGHLHLIFVNIESEDTSVSGLQKPLEEVRKIVKTFAAANESVEAGITGIPVVEADETTQSMIDSTRASILALVLITVLMLLVFRGFRVPIIAVLALLIGLCWSFGWVAVSIGHLQVLSIVFTVVLMGLGIDFALHLIARFEIIHDECDSFAHAVSRTFRGVGPGLITGAITTSAAFAAIGFTDFRGAAELGIIAAGGIVLCLIAVMCAFPAMLVAFGDWRKWVRTRDEHIHHSPLATPLFFVSSHSWPTIFVVAIVAVALGWSALQVRYNPNVLDLQPLGIESVEWEHRLIDDDAESIWAGLSLVDPAEAAARVNAFRALPTVASVGGMGLLFPEDASERNDALNELRTSPPAVLPAGTGYAGLRALLGQVVAGLRHAERSDSSGQSGYIAERIQKAIEAGSELDQAQRIAAWNALNESFLNVRPAYEQYVNDAIAPVEVSANDLPPVMRSQWVGRDGSWLLRIYPTASEQSVLHPDRLGGFVSDLRGVDPDLLGPPVQIYESSILIQRAYVRAALFALPVILIVLLIDFRSLSDPLVAMLPVVLGFVGMFGLMNVFGVPLNFANMIVMPIILGIGVDAGVHVVHRWRAEPQGNPPGLSGGTGRGILVTMMTTMIGFGCMLIAEHRGIRSLGFVMVVGLGTTLIACYTLLPAILALRSRAADVE